MGAHASRLCALICLFPYQCVFAFFRVILLDVHCRWRGCLQFPVLETFPWYSQAKEPPTKTTPRWRPGLLHLQGQCPFLQHGQTTGR